MIQTISFFGPDRHWQKPRSWQNLKKEAGEFKTNQVQSNGLLAINCILVDPLVQRPFGPSPSVLRPFGNQF